jgi:dihydroxy-acid dehydratase
LAVVKTGDQIRLDVPNRQLQLLISDKEIKERLEQWHPGPKRYGRGYYTMYLDHVLQAHEGCDFDFLRATADDKPYEPLIGRT